ncbi:ribonuclease J, partial [Candidatus Woesearchaeota archaeon]|nr:ribonuclease J [Candidatus Woesearchaeota archaeon]
MIEICSVGGYNEVGKNCTAVKIDNNSFILDMGIYLESYIKLTKDEDAVSVNPSDLIDAGAIPDIS